MNLVSRSGWGALPPTGITRLPGPVRGVAVHWEGTPMGTPGPDACDDAVRSIQRFHMRTRGYADIAYSFVVCPHGSVFEGRGWGVQSAANGTNTGNAQWHAVCYLGGTGDEFTAAAKAAIVQVVAEARRRHPAGQDVRPHSWFRPTDCPGGVIRSWLAGDPFMPVAPPAPAPPPTTMEVDVQIRSEHIEMPLDDRGRGNVTVPWPIDRIIGFLPHSEVRPNVDGRYDEPANSVTFTPEGDGTIVVVQQGTPLGRAHVWLRVAS